MAGAGSDSDDRAAITSCANDRRSAGVTEPSRIERLGSYPDSLLGG